MYIYDISKSIIDAIPYEDDPETNTNFIKSIDAGDEYNLSQFSMCTHTATHIDSPFHYDNDGETIDQLRLATFYGKCTVITIKGILTGDDMEKILPYCRARILFKGNGKAFIQSSAAQVIADSKVVLVGTDASSIAPAFDQDKTHRILARGNVAVLENLDLKNISDGSNYTLCAFPIRLDGLEAAPCRAILLEQEKGF